MILILIKYTKDQKDNFIVDMIVKQDLINNEISREKG